MTRRLPAVVVVVALALSAVATAAVCGDGICDESCNTCPTDCGPCQANIVVDRCVNPHQFAFTFDDGPSTFTPDLLDILKTLNIKIGFFQIGVNVDWLPQNTKRAHDEGHYICSHTYTHPSLPTLSAAQIRSEMQKTEASIKAATGCMRPRLMRPPYGDIDPASQQVLWDMGYIPVIWDADTNDWQGWDALVQAEAALTSLNPQSIIMLQHDLYKPSIDDVPAIAAAVKAYGYEIVRIDECVYGTTMTPSRSWQTALCTGAGCGDGKCTAGSETCSSCAADCGVCPPVCGDKKCDPGESCTSCATDCGACPPSCGDHTCASTETCSSCPADCGACPIVCGDHVCQGSETCTSCPADCGACPAVCGDHVCQSTETCSSCATDCGACTSMCGDGTCQATESCATCAADCCSSGSPVFTGPLTTDGTCGSNNPQNAICPAGQCCSKYGWCGTTSAYCAGTTPSTGVPVVCGDKTCNSGAGESCSNCPQDCVCATTCGDGQCASGETCNSCPADCGTCPVTPPPAAVCGDAQCNGSETCSSCAGDCGPCQPSGVVTSCVTPTDYAMTFDGGPTSVTPALLDVLKSKQVRATFFLTGELVTGAGMSAVVQRIVNEGHLIAARSQDNVDFTTLSNDAIRAKLVAVDAAIRAVSCQRPRLLRPPLGKFSDAQRTFLESLGYKLVTWNFDTLDGTASSSDAIVSTVDSFLSTKPTAVIHLQHDKDLVSINAVSAIIDAVRAAGFSLVTLDQCVYGHAPSTYRDFQVGKCPAFCGDYACSASESCSTCSMDCGTCQARCGDGVCSAGETCSTCCADCGACTTRPVSTDGKCGANSANNAVCAAGMCCSQYGWCGTGTAYCSGTSDSGASGCTSSTVCGDKVCSSTETCTSCPSDCGACTAVCGDGKCNGQETCTSCTADCGACTSACGDGVCGSSETCTSCAADCGACPAVCGNSKCESGETCVTCAADCGACPVTCGDHVCAASESCSTCATDCGNCPATCGDHVCAATESCTTCPGDCGACPPVCGDKTCAAGETCSSCPTDCGACPPVCGDNVCSSGETCASCPGDCGSCTAGGACSGCWGTSNGPCKSVIGVCYPFGADGKCVPGTSACTLAATVGLAAASEAVVVTLELASPEKNVTTNDMNSQARAVLVQHVAVAAEVDADQVDLAAMVDQDPALRTGSIDRSAPATSILSSAIVVQAIVTGSSGMTTSDVRNAVLASSLAKDLSAVLSTQMQVGSVSSAAAQAAGAPPNSVSGAAMPYEAPAPRDNSVLLYSLLAVAGVFVIGAIATVIYVRVAISRQQSAATAPTAPPLSPVPQAPVESVRPTAVNRRSTFLS